MTSTLTTRPEAAETPRDRPPLPARLAVAWSAAMAGLAVLWLAVPASYLFRSDRDVSLLAFPPRWAVAVAAGALALAGIGAVLSGRSRLVVVVAVLDAVAFGLVMADVRALIVTAYAVVLFGPPVLLVVLAVGAIRGRVSRVLVLAVFAGLGVLLAVGGWRAVAQLAAGVAVGVPKNLSLSHVYVFVALLGALAWAATAIAYRRRAAAGWTAPDAVARWGRIATLVAAASPLPYILVRATWLTPWPVLLPDGGDLGLRVFGLGLGAAALGGSILTIGLIRPWGTRFPRHLPMIGGRPVPVAAAVAPGLTVALLVTVAGRSTIQMVATHPDAGAGILDLVLVPFPIWGPALAIATAAYYLRRRGHCARCGRG